MHIRRKDYVNSLKKDHAERAKEDQTFLTCNFDLEAVFYSPLFFAKPIFYKRKLAIYNFTVYEVAKKSGFVTCGPKFRENGARMKLLHALHCLLKVFPIIFCIFLCLWIISRAKIEIA